MKFEPKISGVSVSEFGPIKRIPTIAEEIVSLKQIDNLSQRTAQWILDTYNIVSLNPERADDCHYGVIMRGDDIVKASILENYPELEKELIEYFGENWLKYYIRFGH